MYTYPVFSKKLIADGNDLSLNTYRTTPFSQLLNGNADKISV